MSRILIAEDEPKIVSFLEKGLRSHGFTTTSVSDGASTVRLATSADFELLILDLGLPDIDGHEVLRQIRAAGVNLPVVILTARRGLHDKLLGFEAGADDYLTKPFAFDELLARIRARLRPPASSEPVMLEVGNVNLDLKSRSVTVNGEPVELSAKEFILAEALFRHPTEVFSRQQLLSRVWGFDHDPKSNIVDVYVGYLRKKLGSHLIKTVRGVGYRLT